MRSTARRTNEQSKHLSQEFREANISAVSALVTNSFFFLPLTLQHLVRSCSGLSAFAFVWKAKYKNLSNYFIARNASFKWFLFLEAN